MSTFTLTPSANLDESTSLCETENKGNPANTTNGAGPGWKCFGGEIEAKRFTATETPLGLSS